MRQELPKVTELVTPGLRPDYNNSDVEMGALHSFDTSQGTYVESMQKEVKPEVKEEVRQVEPRPLPMFYIPKDERTSFELIMQFIKGKKGRNRMRSSKNYIVEEMAAWVTSILGVSINKGAFFPTLENGEILCMLVNTVGPQSLHIDIAKHAALRSIEAKRNIRRFLIACKQLGTASQNLFKVEDLTERENDRRVMRCLIALSLALINYQVTPPPCLINFLHFFDISYADAPIFRSDISDNKRQEDTKEHSTPNPLRFHPDIDSPANTSITKPWDMSDTSLDMTANSVMEMSCLDVSVRTPQKNNINTNTSMNNSQAKSPTLHTVDEQHNIFKPNKNDTKTDVIPLPSLEFFHTPKKTLPPIDGKLMSLPQLILNSQREKLAPLVFPEKKDLQIRLPEKDRYEGNNIVSLDESIDNNTTTNNEATFFNGGADMVQDLQRLHTNGKDNKEEYTKHHSIDEGLTTLSIPPTPEIIQMTEQNLHRFHLVESSKLVNAEAFLEDLKRHNLIDDDTDWSPIKLHPSRSKNVSLEEAMLMDGLVRNEKHSPLPNSIIKHKPKFNEEEWKELIQNLDFSILLLSQGDESTIDRPTIASCIFPVFEPAVHYDGLDRQQYVDNIADRNMFERARDYSLDLLNPMAFSSIPVKRWMRRGAAVRIDIETDRFTTFITTHPYWVLILCFLTALMSLILLVAIPENSLYFDVSAEQFRVEGHVTTVQNDMYVQGTKESLLYNPPYPESATIASYEEFDKIMKHNKYLFDDNDNDDNDNTIFNGLFDNFKLNGWDTFMSTIRKWDQKPKQTSQHTSGSLTHDMLTKAIVSDRIQNRKLLADTLDRYAAVSHLTLYIYHKKGGNLLTNEYLSLIRQIEQHILGDDQFPSRCVSESRDHIFEFSDTRPNNCRAPDAASNYFYPILYDDWIDEYNYSAQVLKFWGTGSLAPIHTTVAYLHRDNKVGFFDKEFENGEDTSSLYKSQFSLGLPLPGYVHEYDRRGEQLELLLDYLTEVLTEKLMPLKDKYQNIGVYIDGDDIQEYILQLILFNHDAYLLLGSLLCIFVFTVIHLQSVFLTIVSIGGILMAILIWIFAYRVIFGIESLSMLTILAFFLILAIGTDDIFVFWDTWKYSAMLDLRSSELKNKPEQLEQNFVVEETEKEKDIRLSLRISWTLRNAGSAMFVTTFTSAAAFFSIAISPITPVKNFGYFMGGVCIINYILVITWMPAAVIIHHKKFRMCCRKKRHARRFLFNGSGEQTDGGIDHHLVKKNLQLTGDRTGQLGKMKEERMWHEINKRNTWCRDMLLNVHTILYRFRYILLLAIGIGVVFAFFTAITLQPADDVISLLPSDSNLEMVAFLQRSVAALCTACTYPVTVAALVQAPSRTPIPNAEPAWKSTFEALNIATAVSTLAPYTINQQWIIYNSSMNLAEQLITFPSLPVDPIYPADEFSYDRFQLQFQLPSHYGLSNVEHFSLQIIPYPLPAQLDESDYQIDYIPYEYEELANRYFVSYATGNELFIPDNNNYPTFLVPWLKHNQQYLVRLSSINSYGWSNFTEPELITMLDATPNDPVLDGIALLLSNGNYLWQITIVYESSLDIEKGDFLFMEASFDWNQTFGSDPMKAYHVSLLSDSLEYAYTANDITRALFTNNLCADINYHINIRVSNRHDVSNWVEASNSFLFPATISSTPIQVNASTNEVPITDPLHLSVNFITLCPNGVINKYSVEVSGPMIASAGNNPYELATNSSVIDNIILIGDVLYNASINIDNFPVLKTNLLVPVTLPNSIYGIRVRVHNNIGWSDYSDIVYAESIILISEPPQAITATSPSATSLVVKWLPPDYSSQPAHDYLPFTTEYLLEMYEDIEADAPWLYTSVYFGTNKQITLTGLPQNTRLFFRLSSFDGYFWGDYITECFATNQATTACVWVDFPILCLGNDWCNRPSQCSSTRNELGVLSYAPDPPLTHTFNTHRYEDNVIRSDQEKSPWSGDAGWLKTQGQSYTIANHGKADLHITGISATQLDESNICNNVAFTFENENTGFISSGVYITSDLALTAGEGNIVALADVIIPACQERKIHVIVKPGFSLDAGEWGCEFRLLYESYNSIGVSDTSTSEGTSGNPPHFSVHVNVINIPPVSPIESIAFAHRHIFGQSEFEISFQAPDDTSVEYSRFVVQSRKVNEDWWHSVGVRLDEPVVAESSVVINGLSHIQNIDTTDYVIRVLAGTDYAVSIFSGSVLISDCDGTWVHDDQYSGIMCSGNGFCSNLVQSSTVKSQDAVNCVCDDGWYGIYCHSSCPVNDPEDIIPCSGHGVCSSSEGGAYCMCDLGYAGDACESRCPESCNSRGICYQSPSTGQLSCRCFDGYSGSTCAVTDTDDTPTTSIDSTTSVIPTSGASSSSSSSSVTGTNTVVSSSSTTSIPSATSSPAAGSATSGTSVSSSSPYIIIASSSTPISSSSTPSEPEPDIFELGSWPVEQLYIPSLPDWGYGTLQLVYGIYDIKYDNNRFDGTYGKLIYDKTFDLAHEDSQLFHLDLCAYLITSPYVLTHRIEDECFMSHFASYVIEANKYGTFPVPYSNFTDAVLDFLDDIGGILYPHWKESMGFGIDDNGDAFIEWYGIDIKTIFDSTLSGSSLITHYEIWKSEMENINRAAPSTTNKGFQVSDLWVRMNVEILFIEGVIWAYVTSCTFVFIALIVFTRNVRMAAVSVVVIICIVILMVGIMVANGMTLGSIEAISIQIVVGLAVDYLLHLAHRYTHSPFFSRFGRTRHAFVEIGAPVLSAGATTMLSGFMLLFCEVQILAIVGQIIFFMTLVSIVLSSVFFIPLLMVTGPAGNVNITKEEGERAKIAYTSINPEEEDKDSVDTAAS